ncbi:transposase [Thioclava sp. NG1]|uniref:TniB family NTP-binding protein n=1 Tax=Thioclava sp. NG1 TaxID=2182426 RepID=UPI000D618D24|nr:TniB family NTP-binding protein [Thioclava sp. NG1]PWE49082.1 transposase [Thioclava sp. NG1]
MEVLTMAQPKLPKTPVSIAEVVDKLAANHIVTPATDRFTGHFERLFRRSDSDDGAIVPRLHTGGLETRGVMVLGEPGSGKTALVRHHLQNHEGLVPIAGNDWSQYLHITVPSPATLKSVGLEILKKLHYPNISERAERWKIWEAVKHRLSLLGIKVLWIDEAHDLFSPSAARERDDILKTIKSLMQGEHAVVIVLSGTKLLGELTEVDLQVARRFSTVILSEISYASDGENLEGLIAHYAETAGLAVNFTDDLIQRLIYASGNQFGRAVELIVFAIEAALEEGAKQLGVEAFASAWALQEGCGFDENIFVARDWAMLPGPHEHATLADSKRKRGRK